MTVAAPVPAAPVPAATAPTTTPTPAGRRAAWGEYWPFLLGLAGGLACLGLLFHTEIAAAIGVWLDSTAYSHCFLVLPIALWLAWDRREAARGLRPQPTLLPALAVIPFGLAWFAAERLGIMEGRQLAVLGMLEALLVALLGWRLARAQAPALIYLIFLVPVGSFLVPSLQRFTTGFINVGLDLLGIPHFIDSFTIEIPDGTFYVAEACAGLRFLIAAVAFGVLYGFLTYRSVGRRLGFLAASIVVPILANGVRALGIVVAGYIIGDAEAAAADHIIYGWGFFSFVIVLLALGGLPFRQDGEPVPAAAPAPAGPAPGAGRAILAAGLAVLLAAIGPAAATALDRPGPVPDLHLPRFAETADCLAFGDPPGEVQHFSCHGLPLVATLRVLPPHAAPAALRAARSEATGERDAADAVTSTMMFKDLAPHDWRLVELHDPDRITATATWIDGAPDPGGLTGRLLLAWESLGGGHGTPPVLMAIAFHPGVLAHAEQREAAHHALHRFIEAQRPLLTAIERATRR
jgi:exosortase A